MCSLFSDGTVTEVSVLPASVLWCLAPSSLDALGTVYFRGVDVGICAVNHSGRAKLFCNARRPMRRRGHPVFPPAALVPAVAFLQLCATTLRFLRRIYTRQLSHPTPLRASTDGFSRVKFGPGSQEQSHFIRPQRAPAWQPPTDSTDSCPSLFWRVRLTAP